ncbi:MAG: aminoacyl-tRNA hydrolase [Atribacterota bacterium]
MKLFVGLGNPGKQYQYTRHNIGFRVLEAFIIRNIGVDQKWKKGFSSQFLQCHFKGQKTIFAKPQTYMNLSGKSVEKFINYYGISNHQLLVIYDDIHLSLGNIRIRKQGSSGGHKGIESIIDSLSTEEFPRLRIGIRNDLLLQQMDYPSFVLSRFLPEEEQVLKKIIDRAVKALEDIMDFGYEYAMREYNRLEEKEI